MASQRPARRGSTPTTSRAWPRGRRSPTGSTTSPITSGWCRSGSTATPPSSRSRRSARGGSSSAKCAIPKREQLVITADCGGSNGNRTRLWKTELQKLADETGLPDRRLPLPARHQQVEQDRAPPVLLHLTQLARPAADQLRGDHQPDRRDHHQHRAQGLRPPRSERVPQARGHRRRTGRREPHPTTRSTASGTTRSTPQTIRRRFLKTAA